MPSGGRNLGQRHKRRKSSDLPPGAKEKMSAADKYPRDAAPCAAIPAYLMDSSLVERLLPREQRDTAGACSCYRAALHAM